MPICTERRYQNWSLKMKLFIFMLFSLMFSSIIPAQKKDKPVKNDTVYLKYANDPEMLFQLSKIFYKEKKYNLAKELARESFMNNPLNKECSELLKELYDKTGEKHSFLNFFIRETGQMFPLSDLLKSQQIVEIIKKVSRRDSIIKLPLNYTASNINYEGIWDFSEMFDNGANLIIKKNFNDSLKYTLYCIESSPGISYYFKCTCKENNGILVLDKPLYLFCHTVRKFFATKCADKVYLVPDIYYDKVIEKIANNNFDVEFRTSVFRLCE